MTPGGYQVPVIQTEYAKYSSLYFLNMGSTYKSYSTIQGFRLIYCYPTVILFH